MEEIKAERVKQLTKLAERLGVKFNNIIYLHEALTHTSYANEAKGNVVHNERLEFLGDAVLELAVSTYLFKTYPKLPEGELTKARASVVCEATLSKLARKLEFGKYLLLGHGESLSGGADRPSILEDAFESVIGAVYLDQGWFKAQEYVLNQLSDDLATIETGNNLQDYKTIFQEVIQKHPDRKIAYELLSESGPDHNKRFEFAVKVNDEVYGTGIGRSKKEAEQHAAEEALNKIKNK